MAPGMSLSSVNAIIILNIDDGSRIFAKYYNAPHHAPTASSTTHHQPSGPFADVKSQKTFEKGLLDKTAKQTGDIILYDNRIVLYKMESDVMMYVVGGVDENEVLLYNVILALRDSLHLLFKQSVDKRTIIENYDLVSLAIDEIVDDGIILETDPTIIVQRVSKAPTQDVNLSRIDLSEQGVNNLAQLGKAKLTDWLRQGL
ncbi:snare-like protein [Daldinia decipiens]|uniref:snare-like protein n=1 Tax=Daldinia vernicosa TaxID=114800 RepID=UPI0014467B31|nr:putative coatomer subunit zeta [Daldinia childiae]XP_047870057.1 snare-like protein [Daldinia vernicosa]XP_049101689.1 snare-like protein [Daldinia decipiens]KAI0135060.1 snare-like protein [Daldinia grandis]KAF3066497.1 putative coatomer subunit zeta [Daldinia childiae]KAI0854128.1 snare-like protein [Daldinia vernicosa]KAI1659724.1 snare-like protein [Daldinia decipiens]